MARNKTIKNKKIILQPCNPDWEGERYEFGSIRKLYRWYIDKEGHKVLFHKINNYEIQYQSPITKLFSEICLPEFIKLMEKDLVKVVSKKLNF